ncbi:MAG: class I adenylate-forming enzyme family protein [Candidatus Saccharibacteria bacterium]|nr:class I adenylate-forming enzyme family protein [Candidatus Saccharibacteria bacterium]
MLKIKNQKSDPIVPPLSISALFDLSSFRHWKSVVINQKEMNVTRREVKRDRKILAKAFLELGVKKGDIITVATGRSMYDNVLIFLAANKIGAVVSFLDEKVTRDTLIHYLDEFESKILVTYKKTASRIKDLKKDAKTVKTVINLEGYDDTVEGMEYKSILDTFMIGKTPITKYAEKYKGRVPLGILGGKKEALISFTSGSTSGPKPMVFTNENLIAAALFSKAASGIKMWDKEIQTWFSFVKFDCPYGFWTSVLTPIIGGSSVILTPDIEPSNFEYYFGKEISCVQGVPLLLELLPKLLPEGFDLSSVKMVISGGERLEKDLSYSTIEFFKEHGATVKMCNGYGVGECLGSITVAVGSTYNPDTVGRVVPGAHVMILDPETGEELDFGKTGLLHVSGKHVLKRYFNRPELDEEKIVTVKGRRFVNTGDLATVSETGFVTLLGRATFFINNTPAKVYYEVVRAAVAKSDLVSKCYVVKMPDAKLGWSACAFVVPKEGVGKNNVSRRQITTDATKTFYIGKRRITLKSYELPRRVVFLDELPLTKANKTDFRKLERMAKELVEEK